MLKGFEFEKKIIREIVEVEEHVQNGIKSLWKQLKQATNQDVNVVEPI